MLSREQCDDGATLTCGACDGDVGQIQERHQMQPSVDEVLDEPLVLELDQGQDEVQEQADETSRAWGPVFRAPVSAARYSTADENPTPMKQLRHPIGSAKGVATKPPSTWLQQ